MKLQLMLPGSTKGRVGMALLMVGSGVFLIRLYLSLLFYVASERILYYLPSIAPLVTMSELVAQPEDYAGNWVKVRGEVWRRTEQDAILVPPGSGPEPPGTTTNVALLPKLHLYTHNFRSDGVASVSVLDLPVGEAVTIAGEFEPATPSLAEHIDAAVILDPRQDQHDPAMNRRLLNHAVWLVTSGLAGLAGLALLFGGWFRNRIQTLPNQR